MKRSRIHMLCSLAASLSIALCGCTDISEPKMKSTVPKETTSGTTTEETAPLALDITDGSDDAKVTAAEVDAAFEEAEEARPDEPEAYTTATIAFAGDTTQSETFCDATANFGVNYPLGDVAELFSAADLAFVNLETSVSDRGKSEKPEGYGFRTDPSLLEVYKSAGIDIVSCANNHTRDYGYDALLDTFGNLEEWDIRYVGAGRNSAEAARLEVFDLNGIKVGFTACNMINMNPGWYAGKEHAGLMCVDFADCGGYLETIAEYDKQCDVLFVSVHWGIEYYNGITNEQSEFAHMLCDNGADIILGHHPHVLEPIEKYGNSMIFYSLGNFLFYKMDDEAGKTALFNIEIDKNGFVGGEVYPVFINSCKSNLLDEQNPMYGEIIDLLGGISEKYGVTVGQSGGIEILR